MAEWNDPQTTGVTAATVGVPSVTRDAGLRSYMLSVYNYMASGVLLTGIIALGFANSSLINLIVNPATGQATPLFWVALFAPLGLVFALSFGINRISARAAQALFWAYSALVGVQFSSLFLVYTGASVARRSSRPPRRSSASASTATPPSATSARWGPSSSWAWSGCSSR